MFAVQKISTIVSTLLFAWFVSSCANKQAPSGGPPDTDPPVIISTEPEQNALMFSGKRVRFSFDEHLNRQQFRESIIIFPETQFELSWSGKTAVLSFPNGLDSATTYSIALGTEYSDISGNKPEESFTLLFSTGQRLDEGGIQGTVIGDSLTGAFVFAYQLDSLGRDTLNPENTEAKYKAQLGDNGRFSFAAMPPGYYRLFVVRDEYRDSRYDPDSDIIGCATQDVELDSAQTVEGLSLLLPPKAEKSRPALFGATAVTPFRGYCKYSKAIIADTAVRITIVDSAETLPPRSPLVIYRDPSNASVLMFETDFRLSDSIMWMVSASGVKDSLGLTPEDSLETTEMVGADEEKDTLAIRVAQRSFEDEQELFSLSPTLQITLTRPIDTLTFAEGLALLDSNDNVVPGMAYLSSPITIEIEPEAPLKPGNMYRLRVAEPFLKARAADVPSGPKIQHYPFLIFDKKRYGAMSGTLMDMKEEAKKVRYIVEFLHYKDAKRTNVPPFIMTLDSAGAWEMPDLMPGDYHIQAYTDEDGTGKLFFGQHFPFKPASRFFRTTNSLTVKSRWTVEDVRIVIPER